MIAGIICKRCGEPAPKRGHVQKYCAPCSAKSHAEVQARSAAKNKKPMLPGQFRGVHAKKRLALREIGAVTAEANRTPITHTMADVNLAWVVRVSAPFSYVASKNAIYTQRRGGHVAIRAEARQWRDALTASIRDAVADKHVKQNKLWVDIFVQKSDHRGDAVNVVDFVCDAIKVGVDLDDRWFCIRRVDWEIVRTDGRIFVGIGQEDVENVQVCSYCGRALPFDRFGKKKTSKHGIGRECFECRRSLSAMRRAA